MFKYLLQVALVCAALMSANLFVGTAQAQTWLDQRFYDEPPRKTKTKTVTSTYSTTTTTASLTGVSKPQVAAKKKSSGTKVAALTKDYDYTPPKKSLSGGSVNWVASSGCLDGSLKSVIYQVAANFGPVTVSSTCRSKSHNAKVGGAPKSKHLSGDAADFRVHSNAGSAYAFLKSHGSVGGLKHYGGGLFHIDNGARRSW
jgi:hypothetical protein